MNIIIKSELDKERAISQIKALNIEIMWNVEVKRFKKNRSLAQSRLYWKWLQIIGDELGYTKDELHHVFARKFLEPVVIHALGEEIISVRSTTKLKVDEFTNYLRDIENFAQGDLGIILPTKDDMYFESVHGAKR